MRHLRSFALAAALVATTGSTPAAQEPTPAGAFKAVHLVSLTPQQVAALLSWMADMNAAIAKAGHKDVRYRLYKVTGKQAGKYEFMWESSWPSGDVYAKIHNRPEWKSIADKHSAGLSDLLKDEIYNRYVEVLPQ
jgi:hypothetical protein